MRYPRLVRHAEGGIRVTLPLIERDLLVDMAQTLASVIRDVDGDTPQDQLAARLFPAAYDDPLDQMEYAETGIDLLADVKRTMLDTFAASLGAGEVRGDIWRMDLDDEETAAWLAVLQDGRLVLSGIVGIESETDWEDLDERDEQAAMVLDYLAHLTVLMINVLEGEFDD